MKFELDKFHRDVPDEELLQDLMVTEAKLKEQGKWLNFRSYNEFGKYSAQTISVRFGSWNDGLQSAGLTPRQEKNVPVEYLFDNLKVVWIAKGKQPVYRDMNAPPSKYVGSTYNDRFGGWRIALEQFVVSVEQERYDLLKCEFKGNRVTKRTKRDPSLSLRFFVLKRDRFCCVSCGQSPATKAGLELEVDHKLAWSKGGETTEENLQTLCFDCNRGKGASQ